MTCACGSARRDSAARNQHGVTAVPTGASPAALPPALAARWSLMDGSQRAHVKNDHGHHEELVSMPPRVVRPPKVVQLRLYLHPRTRWRVEAAQPSRYPLGPAGAGRTVARFSRTARSSDRRAARAVCECAAGLPVGRAIWSSRRRAAKRRARGNCGGAARFAP